MDKYKVLDIKSLSKNTVRIRAERPDVLIKAGQCFNLGVLGMGINREYSMYSAENAPFLEFLIRVVDDGLVSSNLAKLKVGDEVEIDGPYGEFCLPPETKGKKFLFIASGTGVAPFHSFVKSVPDLDYLVVHGIRHPEETYDSESFKPGCYFPCISKNVSGNSTRVTDFIKNNIPKSKTMVYLCGNRNMIVDTVEILLENGVGGDQIVTEVFF
jgi:ferredoxin/flavodoxin---NADP+ reductase